MPDSTDNDAAALETLTAAARHAPMTSSALKRLATELESVDDVSVAIDHAVEFGGPETAARLMLAAAEMGQPPTAAQVARVLPSLLNTEHMPILVGCATGDRPGMLIDLVAGGRMDSEGEAMGVFLAVELIEGSPPPELIAQLRRLCGRSDPWGPSPLLGAAVKAVDDPDLSAVAEDCLAAAEAPWAVQAVSEVRSMLAGPPHEFLASQGPTSVVSGFTARRPVEKIGRNDPCPCGSGKKYKRCCMKADAARLSNPSPVAGLTMNEYLEQAGEEMDIDMFMSLKPWDLKRLDFRGLPTRYLVKAVGKFSRAKYWAEAEQVMDILADRGDVPGGVDDERVMLTMDALDAGETDVARRQAEQFQDPTNVPESVRLALEFEQDRPRALQNLEDEARGSLDGSTDDRLTVPFSLFRRYPALGILTARAHLDAARPFDSEVLLGYIEEARVGLDLPPGDRCADDYEQLAERHYDQVMADTEAQDLTEQKEELLEELKQLRERLRKSTSKSRALEQAHDEATAQLAEMEKRAEERSARSEATKQAETEPHSATAKAKVDELKALIAQGNEERADLRTELARLQDQLAHDARSGESLPGAAAASDGDSSAPLEVAADAPAGSDVLLPSFTKRAEEAIRQAPQRVARGAVVLAASLAAREDDAWRGVKSLQSASGMFSVRPGYRYRMLFEVDSSRGLLLVADLVPRKDLETAIKRYR